MLPFSSRNPTKVPSLSSLNSGTPSLVRCITIAPHFFSNKVLITSSCSSSRTRPISSSSFNVSEGMLPAHCWNGQGCKRQCNQPFPIQSNLGMSLGSGKSFAPSNEVIFLHCGSLLDVKRIGQVDNPESAVTVTRVSASPQRSLIGAIDLHSLLCWRRTGASCISLLSFIADNLHPAQQKRRPQNFLPVCNFRDLLDLYTTLLIKYVLWADHACGCTHLQARRHFMMKSKMHTASILANGGIP